MNEQEIQFVRKAIENRWLFWLYFWRIPKYLKVMADEMERVWASESKLVRERDESIKANTNLLKWVHVTHRLSTTPDAIRALFAAGKRLQVILFLAFAVNAFAAPPPPLLRQYFTTNAFNLSNGAGALTNDGSGILGWLSLSSLSGGGGDTIWTNDGTSVNIASDPTRVSFFTNGPMSVIGGITNHNGIISFPGTLSTMTLQLPTGSIDDQGNFTINFNKLGILVASNSTFFGGINAVNSTYAALDDNLIAGGENHTIAAGVDNSVILGGFQNEITTGDFSAIVGGDRNVIATNAVTAFIGGGQQNRVTYNSGSVSGLQNSVDGNDSFIAAGNNCLITANSGWAAILASDTSTITGPAGADYFCILPGLNNNIAYALNTDSFGYILGGRANRVTKANSWVIGMFNTNAAANRIELGYNDINEVIIDTNRLHLIGDQLIRQTNSAIDGYVLTSTEGGTARWLQPGATINYYVDQAAGSDSNTGLSSGSAYQTIAKLTNTIGALPNNVTINLARGSLFREQLTVGTNNVVKAYGSGPRPILNASDIATNINWIKLGGTFTNVWMYTNWTITGGGAPSYFSVAENGVQLIRSNTLAGLDLMPGTFFAIDDAPAGSTTNVLFIHPRNSTVVTNDGKLYEISKRNYGFLGSDNCTVEDIHTTGPHFSNNGSFETGKDSLIRRCLFENGTKHNMLFASGVVEDCVAWKQEYALGSATLFDNFSVTDGLQCVYRRCAAIDGPTATAFFGHTLGPGYGFLLFEDCLAQNCQSWGSSSIASNGVAIFNRCRSIGLSLGAWSMFSGTNIFLDCSVQHLPSVTVSPSFADIGINSGATASVWIANCTFPTRLTLTSCTNVNVQIHQSYVGTISSPAGSSNCVFVSSNNIAVGAPPYDLFPGNTLVAAASNVFPLATQFRVNGTLYNTFGDYIAALPTLEAGSTTNNLQSVGSASNGDFRYAVTSPAVTNQAGPGWFSARRPDFPQGLRETTTLVGQRQANGSWIENSLISSTNDLWAWKLNRTNDTATELTVAGGFTNFSAAKPFRISSVGNVTVEISKSAAGNTLEVALQAATTRYGALRVDSGSQMHVESANNNILNVGAHNNYLQLYGGGGGADIVRFNNFAGAGLSARAATGGDWHFAGSVTITNSLYAETNTAPYDLDVTDLVVDTWYTNDSRRSVVSLSFELDSNTTGTAKAGIYVDQAKDGTFETTKTVQALGLADPQQQSVSAWLQPGARFAITNLSSGAGSPTVAVVAGSCQWVKQ